MSQSPTRAFFPNTKNFKMANNFDCKINTYNHYKARCPVYFNCDKPFPIQCGLKGFEGKVIYNLL